MTDAEIIAVIRGNGIFRHAGKRSLDLLLECERRSFAPRETVYSAGKFERSLGIILSGDVEVFGATEGKRVRLREISCGETFGAAAIFGSHESYVSTVVAKHRSEILFVTEEVMREILESDGACMLDYVSFLSDKIRFLNSEITSFTSKNADSAVAGFIKNHPEREFSVNMSRLSRQLDMGRSSLYRAIENLVASGAIEYESGKIKVLSEKILNETIK